MNLKEINEKIQAKAKALHDIFEEAGTDMDMSKVKSLTGDNDAKAATIKTLNDELSDLGKERDKLTALQKAREAADSNLNASPAPIKNDPGSATKSLGQLIMGSPAIKSKGQTAVIDIEQKTLFERTAGFGPESTRTGRVELYPARAITVVDNIPIIPTSQAAIKYMEETTMTNNAAEAAEGGLYGEAALVYTERSVPVEKVAVWLPVTDEQLEDVPGMAALIDQRLRYMLEAKLDTQVLNGSGTPPALQGLIGAAVVGSINTQAKGADPTPDAFYKAMTLVRTVGFAEPDLCIINPSDWQDIRLLRTADGIYIFGSPMDPGPDRLWGVKVVLTTAATANTGIVGAFGQFSALYMKRGLEVKISDSHDTYFIYGKQAIRADIRCAQVWFRKSAFARVTGI
jgi:HK97 family phage major capsid protein